MTWFCPTVQCSSGERPRNRFFFLFRQFHDLPFPTLYLHHWLPLSLLVTLLPSICFFVPFRFLPLSLFITVFLAFSLTIHLSCYFPFLCFLWASCFSFPSTVESRYTGPKINGNPLITNALVPSSHFFFTSYNGNNKNPPITDEICWSLDIRYCES